MLIRDTPKTANHDYLDIPETFEDICKGYSEQFGTAILERIKNNLVPKIIKYWHEADSAKYDYNSIVILYLYSILHEEDLSIHTNTCFDREGATVSLTRIDKVEMS